MANIFSRFFSNKKEEKREYEEWTNPIFGTVSFNTFSQYTQSKAMKLSTVYRCVNLISDSIASLPFYPYTYKDNWKYINYDSTLYNLLNVQPNPYMGKFIFMKLVVTSMLLKGAAYIYIDRAKNGSVVGLTLLNADNIETEIKNNDVIYFDKINKKAFDKSQLIIILNYSTDGLNGISTLSYAALTLEIAYNTDEHSRNFFKSGANLAGILRPLAGVNIGKEKALKAKKDFINALNSDLGGQSGAIVVLDSGLEYQPITISPKDSQLIESKQFNVVDICRFFNVPPSLAFSESGKFSTAEQQGLDYLNNCLLPIIEKFENEFFRKLYLPSEWDVSDLKFDTENLVRLDATTRADVMVKLHSVGGYTTNEIREKLNSTFPVNGGNRAFIQTNLQPTDALIAENKLDNNLK
ncbi:MAG: phage portal protein [Bacteroidales bacterium]|nr:phage portal protein [Bacteroidales bacterium]